MPQRRVLVDDQFEPEGIKALQHLGLEVELINQPERHSLSRTIREFDPEILIVGAAPVTSEVIESATSLRLIVCTADHAMSVDVVAASAHGIAVAVCPRAFALANAELAWSLLLATDRELVGQTTDLRSGQWKDETYSTAMGLQGRTLGLIGSGLVIESIAERARSFGMHLMAWSPVNAESQSDSRASLPRAESAVAVAEDSDFIIVHARGFDDIAKHVGSTFCRALRPGTVLVITAGLREFPESTLIEAMEDRKVRIGVALDPTFEPDFMPSGVFLRAKGLSAIHRMGASTIQARRAVAKEAVETIARYHRTGQPIHCVNRAATTPANTLLTIRMRNQPGVLAHVFYILGQAKVNVEEMENAIYEGHRAACARIQLDSPLSEDMLHAIRANHAVISAECITLAPVPESPAP